MPLAPNFLKLLGRSGLSDHGARKADARGAGVPFHHLMEASMACKDQVR